MSRAWTMAGVGLAAGVAGTALRRWHTGWGATPRERSGRLPGDEVGVSGFGMRATRAITIDAPPEDVWPWIVQLGVGKAGWYSYDLLDNLARPSSTDVLPQWQRVAIGDPAAPMDPFAPLERSPWRVAGVEPASCLLWRNDTAGTWAWSLRPLPDGGTRLVSRIRISYASPGGLAFAPLLEVADFPMYRRMLLGIKQRAERLAGERAAG
ncbi:MAG: SRPBCC family protein [Propionicimonas sp.]|nr:SRPBCC family protein [Propionicimonas sp.]